MSWKPTSRLHYSKVYPIEMNVKVKEIGMVCPADLDCLIAYYNQENNVAPPAVSAGYSSVSAGNSSCRVAALYGSQERVPICYVSFPTSSDPPATPTQPARISTNSFSENRTYDLPPPSKSQTESAADKDRKIMTGRRKSYISSVMR